MNIAKLFGAIIFAAAILGGIIAFLVPPIKQIPQDVQNNVILIVAITAFGSLLFFILFLIPFGFTNLNKVLKLAKIINVLKKEDLKKTLSDLKELPNIIPRLKMEIMGKLKIVEHYDHYTTQKVANSMWVLGASLSNPVQIKEALEKEITCEYLCPGNETTVKERAQKIINFLGVDNARKYIERGQVKIYYIGDKHVQFPQTFYDPNADDAEVLIYFPRDIEVNIGKHAILIKNEEAAQYFKDEYNNVKENWQWGKNDTTGEKKDTEILKELIVNPIII